MDSFDFSNLLKGSAGIKKTKETVKSETNENTKTSKENKSVPKGRKIETDKDKIKIVLDDENTIKAISNTADNLINEIKMSIEHYIQENSKTKIEKIVLAGNNLLNFDKYIKQETNYKVEKLDCSGSFDLDSLKKNPAYSSFSDLYKILNPLAIGMALRGIKQ
ncbi:MAG: hypothetical protein KAI62_06395 [Actinomycetia bacterium]|nr:hypothetical protein [Actinomycetes bacterium]